MALVARISLRSVLLWLSALPLLALGASVVRPLWQLAKTSERLPMWDMAKYGLDGLRLAQAVEHLDVLGGLRLIRQMSVWPPVFPLLEVPAFWLLGGGYGTPRLLMVGLFTFSLVAIFSAGCAMESRSRAATVGLLASIAFALAPLLQVFGAQVMLEIPGALLGLLAFAAYCRALGRERLRDWHWVGLFSVALFFCKYNYGLIWLISMLLSEALLAAGSWRQLLGVVGRRLGKVRWRRPWILFLASYGLFLLLIRFSGGLHWQLGEFRLQSTSLGNPVYALYLLVLGKALLRPGDSLRRWRLWWRGLQAHRRILLTWILLPIAWWMLDPLHTKEFFAFLENRSSGLSLSRVDTWLFYPRVFVSQFSASVGLGWAILILAGIFLLRGWGGEPRRRVLALVLMVGWVLVLAHPYKLPRFLTTIAPYVYLAAAASLADGFSWLFRRRLEWRLPALAGWLVAVCASLFVAGLGPDLETVREGFAARTVSPAQGALLDDIAELTAASPGVVLLGAWNELSPALVGWHFERQHPAQQRSDLSPHRRLRMARFIGQERSAEAVAEELRALPAGHRVLVIDGLKNRPSSQRFRAATGWLDPVRRGLGRSGDFVREGKRRYAEGDFVLILYRRK